jgi:hypothetical protein
VKKFSFCQVIAATIKAAGVRKELSAKDIMNKIGYIEESFKRARDWAENTGQGVKESGGHASFEKKVRDRCKWYFDLYPIFGARSSSQPRMTSETLIDDNSSIE